MFHCCMHIIDLGQSQRVYLDPPFFSTPTTQYTVSAMNDSLYLLLRKLPLIAGSKFHCEDYKQSNRPDKELKPTKLNLSQ